MKITTRLLRQHEACSEQVELFAKLFPEGTAVTLKSLKRAAEGGLELDWFAGKFLSLSAAVVYHAALAKACAAYDAAMDKADAAYDAAADKADAAYDADRAKPQAVYQAAMNKASAAYHAVQVEACAAHQAAVAEALWGAWKKEKA